MPWPVMGVGRGRGWDRRGMDGSGACFVLVANRMDDGMWVGEWSGVVDGEVGGRIIALGCRWAGSRQ